MHTFKTTRNRLKPLRPLHPVTPETCTNLHKLAQTCTNLHKLAEVCSQRGRNLPNLYTLITPYDSSHITQAMYDPHLTQYESFVPQLQSNIRIGSGTQHTHGIVTPFIPGSFPLSPHHACAPTWLLPILLARTELHSRDQQHRRDEWVSGNMGLRPKLGRASGSSTSRCVALRWRWSMPVLPQASTIIPGEPRY